MKKIDKTNLSDEERKILEIDADTRAIELILSTYRSKEMSELAIIIGLASILFFNNNLDGGNKHPNIDTRLTNAINKLKLSDDSPIWPFLVLVFKDWDKQFILSLTHQSVYDKYKDFFDDLLSAAQSA
jgi:hypothetical protein